MLEYFNVNKLDKKYKMNEYYVYKHLRNDTNECFYIGKGKNNRLYSTLDRNNYWHEIADSFGFKAEIVANNLSEENAYELEKILIATYRNNGENLTNIYDGGKHGKIPDDIKNKRAEDKKIKEKNYKIKKISQLNTEQIESIIDFESSKLRIAKLLKDKVFNISALEEKTKISKYILRKIINDEKIDDSIFITINEYLTNLGQK